MLERAREVTGLDEEIALMRTKMRTAAQGDGDLSKLLRGMELLVRAVSANQKMNAGRDDGLYDSVVSVLKRVCDVLGIADEEGIDWTQN